MAIEKKDSLVILFEGLPAQVERLQAGGVGGVTEELTIFKKGNEHLPEGWNWSLLDKVADVVAGNPAPQGEQFFENGIYPFVRVQDMGRLGLQKRINQTNDYINDKAIEKLKLIPKGSVLFTKSGASTLLNQRAVLGSDMYVVSHIAAAIPHDGIISEWLYYWLKTVDFNYIAHATTLPSLPLSKARGIPIPIAPLNEQKRIVAEIEKQFSRLDEAVDNLKRVKANLKRYKASVLKAAVEGKLTEEWRKKNLPAPSSKPGKFYTYAILCDNDSIYIGHTDDIEQRWKQHLEGKGAEWTTKHKPVKMVHWEEFDTRKEAAEREKWLKTGYGRKWIKREYAADRTRQAGHIEPADKLLERILTGRRKKWEEAELARLRERAARRQAKMKEKGKEPRDDKWKKKYKEPLAPETEGLNKLPDNWTWCSFGQLIQTIKAGKSFKCNERPPNDKEVGVVKVSAVTWGEFNEVESKTVTDKFKVNQDYLIHQGDFLFSRANTIELVGACVIANLFKRKLMLSDKILRLDLTFDLKKWCLVCLRTRFGRNEIESLATGNQESMRNISQANIMKIRLPLPPIEEQYSIINELEQILTQCEMIDKMCDVNLKRADRLRQSILKKAFSGKLGSENKSQDN